MAITLPEIHPHPRVRRLAIGVFDGVHLGHQEIIRQILSGLTDPREAAVLTFEPHPLEVVAPLSAPARLTLEEQKVRLLGQSGLKDVVVVRFDETLRSLSAHDFVLEIHRLFPQLTEVIVGPNWTFGHHRQGNVESLGEWGAAYGFTARALPLLQLHGLPVSSTRVREALARRSFAEARELLGYDYAVEGVVIHGEQLGRKIGFPTANIGQIQQLLPPSGVYAGYVEFADQRYPAVMNYGRRPTVDPVDRLLLEAHLLGFHGDLYGRRVRVSGFQFLREEKRFGSLLELQTQIELDVQEAQRRLGVGC